MTINPFKIYQKWRDIQERIYILEEKRHELEGKLSNEIQKNEKLRKRMMDYESELRYRYYSLLPESQYPEELKKLYYVRTGRRLNLDKPQTYNEKIQWFKLYGVSPQIRNLVDKYKVREYVRDKIGEKYLIPLLGVWNYPEDIDFSTLPEKFVIKANHGCQYNYIVRDKSSLNRDAFIKTADRWLTEDFAFRTLEMQYHNMQKYLIAEELLENDVGEDIPDYKFFCFDGKPTFFWIDFNRYGNHKRNIYDMNWNLVDWIYDYDNIDTAVIKPEKWEEMVQVVRKLSEGFSHVRVDLYYAKRKVYFGELTFTTGSGFGKFIPDNADYMLGNMWKL